MQIPLPKKTKIVESGKNYAVFEVEGCYPGYGLTLGNSFRRVLLSSLSGAAIVGVKIKGVKHEFSTIPNVLEDVIQIILNLKQIRFKILSGDTASATLKVKGEKKVTAADIKTTAESKVINTDAHIATLTSKKAELEIEMDIEAGFGYLPVEQRQKEKIEIRKIAIDASFTPIRRVYYTVENMRVGDRTDYNRIRFYIETDGSITPQEAFQKAARILVNHYQIFCELEDKKPKSVLKAKASDSKKSSVSVKKSEKTEVLKTKVEDLKLSSRTITALQSAGIKTISGLTKKKETDIAGVEGLGPKGIKEIKRVLSKQGLTLK